MARKQKHPKLPNGFGSIKKLSGNRSNPYAVYPPTTEFAPDGSPKTPKALCYVSDWYTGFYALMEYKNGTFDPEKIAAAEITDTGKYNDVISKIIASYNRQSFSTSSEKTFEEVYKLYYADKFENPKKKFTRSTLNSYRAAYLKCTALYNRPMKSIRKADMQQVLDSCDLSYSSLACIKSLFSQMFAYALQNGIVEMDYSQFVTINSEKDIETGEPFTEHEIELLWKNKDNPLVQPILIMIYTGMRIGELKIVEINRDEKYFKGGLKTTAGKERIIPFPESIIEYIENFNQDKFSPGNFRDKQFYKLIQSIGMDPLTNGKKHTPHDCRHTFSWLCDKYGVDDFSKHLLMGHSLGSDVEKSVYGHRTIEQLRTEINKIEVPDLSLTCY